MIPKICRLEGYITRISSVNVHVVGGTYVIWVRQIPRNLSEAHFLCIYINTIKSIYYESKIDTFMPFMQPNAPGTNHPSTSF